MRVQHLIPVFLAVVLVAGLTPVGLAAGPHTESALGALSWIAARQQSDGSFPGFGVGSTADAVFAICAVGGDPNGFLKEGSSPISYLGAHVDELAANAGTAGKVILAAVCAGKDPRAFGGADLVAALDSAYNASSGQYGTDLSGHAFALLALAATGRPIPAGAVAWLRSAQVPDGSWAWHGTPTSGDGDTNSTALAIQALVAAGVSTGDPAVSAALAYLHTQQNDDGGFPYAKPSPYGSDTDANSTAYVIQALVAAGEDPEGPAWAVQGRTALTALWSLQLPSGALEWQAGFGENELATYQAVPAFMLKPFPLATTIVGEAPPFLPDTGVRLVSPVVLAVGAGFTLVGWALRRGTRGG